MESQSWSLASWGVCISFNVDIQRPMSATPVPCPLVDAWHSPVKARAPLATCVIAARKKRSATGRQRQGHCYSLLQSAARARMRARLPPPPPPLIVKPPHGPCKSSHVRVSRHGSTAGS